MMPSQLRNTFAVLLAWENVIDPVQLWEKFKSDYRRQAMTGDVVPTVFLLCAYRVLHDTGRSVM